MIYFVAMLYATNPMPVGITYLEDKNECIHLASNMTRLMRYGVETEVLDIMATPYFVCVDEEGNPVMEDES